MNNQILSLIGWRFLPDLAAGWVQAIYYSIIIRAGEAKPLPNSPRYSRDRRYIYISVVSAYLLFTIYEADWEIRQKPNFYQVLNVAETANEKEIKTRFRRLAALHHPDKVGIKFSPATEAYFVQLKLAQDTLVNPVKRFAYERFGPSILQWERCSTMRDYLVQGLYAKLPSFLGSVFVMSFFEFLGYVRIGNFWLWLAFINLGVFELRTVSSPYISPIFTHFLNPILTTLTRHPPFLPFQFLQLAHKSCLTLYVALSQIGPFFEPPSTKDALEVKKSLERLETKVKAIDVEASRILNLEMTPFSREHTCLDSLQGKMKDWLVQNTIRMDVEVRHTMNKLVEERNSEVKSSQ